MARLLRRSARRSVVAPVVLATAFVLIPGPAASNAAPPGLVAAYSFSEGSGSTVADASGNGNGGTIGTATWSASGKYGGSLSFNGTTAKVTVPHAASLDLSTAMTLEAWVRPSAVTNKWRDVIYRGNDNYYLEATSQPGIRPDVGGTFGGTAADIRGSAALAVNAWSYLTGTYDGSTLRLYVNGTQVATQTRTGAITTSTNPLTIGGDPIFGQYFAGLIDEVRVYNVALSAAQIQTDMNTPIAPDTQAPSAPGVVSATAAGPGEIDLSWGAASDNVAVSGYQVFRCQGAGCSNFVLVASPATTGYSNTGLSAGTSYSYQVRALDAAGNQGPFSAAVTASTSAPLDTQAPSAPGVVSASVAGVSEIDLSWGAASDNVAVSGYQVFRCQGAGCSNFVLVASPATTGYSNTGLSAGTSYSYQVRALDAAGNQGPFSAAVTASTSAPLDTQAPSAPGVVSASVAGVSEIDLSWGAASDNVAVSGYQVFRCQGAGCSNFVLVASPATTGYSNTGLSAGTSYSYQVRALDAAGNQGPFSAAVTASTSAPLDTQAPSAPGVVSASVAGVSEIDLSWGAASDNVAVSGYQVFRCQGAGCSNFVLVASPATTGYSNTGLSAGTSYSYQVRALDAAGNQGPFSAAVTASTSAPLDTQAPSAPGVVSASVAGVSEIDLSWGAASDNVAVSGYQVFRCQGAGCSNFVLVASPATTGYSNTGLSAGTSYSYQVRALDAAGNQGPFSAAVTASTSAPPSGLVAAYSFDAGSGSTATDSSGSGNTGTITNAIWSTQGKYGGALSFNGSNARVNVANSASLQLSSGMTLEAWVDPAAVSSVWRDVIYKGDDNYYMEAMSDSGAAPAAGGTFAGSNANVFATAALPANTWSFLALTYNGSILRLYVNGTQVATFAKSGNISTSTNQLSIGGDSIYGQYFNGLIDNVRIYSTSLTQVQVQTDMTSPVGGGSTDSQPPSAPGTLTATAAGPGEIDLSWGAATDNVAVTGYQVFRCQGVGCSNFAQLTTTTATGYSNTGLSPTTSYSYQVRAVDAAANQGPFTATATAGTPAASDTQPPSAPGTLTATAAGPGEIDLSWGAATDNVAVTGYHIERCQGAGCTNFVEIATSTIASYSDTAAPAQSDSYRVRANDGATNLGPYSNTATATATAGGSQVVYQGTDANGVASYSVTSADDGLGTQVLRVLAPTSPAPGVPHNFLYVLPVEAGTGTVYGDGLETLRALDAQDQYNLTIIEPSFGTEPWYADNPNDPNLRYETFMSNDLVPWVTQHLALTGLEENWLIGFSKSGIGGQDLILKHPDLFALAASWDFPADMSAYDQFGFSSAGQYGTDANFQANYRLTSSFLDAHKAPFLASPRIWIGGYLAFQGDMSDYDALLTSKGIAHTTETPLQMPHRWDSGWVPMALAALRQDST